MDTTEAPELKPTQKKFLAGLLEGRPFSDLCRELEMTKANGALLLDKLRDVGLIVHHPELPSRRRAVSELDKAGAVLWWDDPVAAVPEKSQLDPRYVGPGRWSVVAMPITRHERADLKPDRWVCAVTAPWGSFAFIASDRDRLSYNLVARELYRGYEDALGENPPMPEDWATTVRTVTEMVADAMGVQSVLPVQFIRQEEGDDGDAASDGEDGGNGDAAAGGGPGSS